jgi:phosphatidylglycerol:prolipoprotein diacylglycerol transferase
LLDPFAGAAFGLIAALVYGQRKSLTLWPALDALTPGLAVFAVFLGLSHLASGSAFGAPTRLPWGIDLWGAHRHPTQIYETILAGLIAWMVWPGLGFVRTQTPGRRFLIFIALSAAARLFLEAFRGDSSLVLGGLRAAQIVAWVILAASLLALNLQKQVAASNAAERKPFAPQDRG